MSQVRISRFTATAGVKREPIYEFGSYRLDCET
jgi:hypothetical protein